MALCVLLCVLVWVGGGGLDIPASNTSTSGVAVGGALDGGGGLPDEGGVPVGETRRLLLFCCVMLKWAVPRFGSLARSWVDCRTSV